MIYQPREDSILLAKQVKKYAKGKVLDIGTGSGIQALESAKKKNVSFVIAVDIQKEVIEYCKKNIKNKKISFFQSDLFEIFNKLIKFDTIIFNPPYLPEDIRLNDLTIEGGKKGYEIIERFLNQVNNFLKENGIILIVFSSLTKKEKIDEFIKNNLLEYKELSKKHIFFEDLYVYLIKKSALLKKLEKKNIRNIKYFAKGKRGITFLCNFKNKIAIIKTKRPESKAVARIQNETKFLKALNKKDIGPRLLFYNKDYLVYGFIDGEFIVDYLENNKKEDNKKIIRDIFEQLFVMDKLKINKEEMHHPLKHIIVRDNKPYLIDFERCHKSVKQHNVTQFCQFILSIRDLLKTKNIIINEKNIIKLSQKYKKEANKKNLNKILKEIK